MSQPAASREVIAKPRAGLRSSKRKRSESPSPDDATGENSISHTSTEVSRSKKTRSGDIQVAARRGDTHPSGPNTAEERQSTMSYEEAAVYLARGIAAEVGLGTEAHHVAPGDTLEGKIQRLLAEARRQNPGLHAYLEEQDPREEQVSEDRDENQPSEDDNEEEYDPATFDPSKITNGSAADLTPLRRVSTLSYIDAVEAEEEQPRQQSAGDLSIQDIRRELLHDDISDEESEVSDAESDAVIPPGRRRFPPVTTSDSEQTGRNSADDSQTLADNSSTATTTVSKLRPRATRTASPDSEQYKQELDAAKSLFKKNETLHRKTSKDEFENILSGGKDAVPHKPRRNGYVVAPWKDEHMTSSVGVKYKHVCHGVALVQARGHVRNSDYEHSHDGSVNPETLAVEYCECNGPESGRMYLCDDPECNVGWYHEKCLGLDDLKNLATYSGIWVCKSCVDRRFPNEFPELKVVPFTVAGYRTGQITTLSSVEEDAVSEKPDTQPGLTNGHEEKVLASLKQNAEAWTSNEVDVVLNKQGDLQLRYTHNVDTTDMIDGPQVKLLCKSDAQGAGAVCIPARLLSTFSPAFRDISHQHGWNHMDNTTEVAFIDVEDFCDAKTARMLLTFLKGKGDHLTQRFKQSGICISANDGFGEGAASRTKAILVKLSVLAHILDVQAVQNMAIHGLEQFQVVGKDDWAEEDMRAALVMAPIGCPARVLIGLMLLAQVYGSLSAQDIASDSRFARAKKAIAEALSGDGKTLIAPSMRADICQNRKNREALTGRITLVHHD